jgi:DNA gyrase subunit A
MGVKFVTPKGGDAVAVVTRSVEAKVIEDENGTEVDAEADAQVDTEDGSETPTDTAAETPGGTPEDASAPVEESADDRGDATIEPDETS